MSNRSVNQLQVNPYTKHCNGHQGARGHTTNQPGKGTKNYNGGNYSWGGRGGRGCNSQRSKTWIPYHKWSKMTTKERWEAKNQNKAKGRSRWCDCDASVFIRFIRPKGKPVTISCFVDASHACDVVTRCSQTGILIFVNWAVSNCTFHLFWFTLNKPKSSQSSKGESKQLGPENYAH